MNINVKSFITFATATTFILLLLPAVKAQETFPRRNAVVIAVEKVGIAVANLSTEEMLIEKRADLMVNWLA